MNKETTSAGAPRRRLRIVMTLIGVVLALMAFEAFFSASRTGGGEQNLLAAWVGVRAPDFTVTNLDGQAMHLADLKGRRVILNFWATWCPPCREELPDFIKLREETSVKNVIIIGLSTDDAATQRAFAQKAGMSYPLVVLQSVPSPYQDIAVIPVTVVIDRNGVIEQVATGPQDLKVLEKFASEPDYSGTIRPAPDSQ